MTRRAKHLYSRARR